MSGFVRSIEAEFRRYRAIAEAAMGQVTDEQLHQSGPGEGNSIAILAWHVGGNLQSRFTDFLDSDGEKPWRQRDSEFESRKPERQALQRHWERGWEALLGTLGQLEDTDCSKLIQIRGTDFRVDEALHRALAHVSYHVGQIVYLARAWRGAEWKFLSIPPGQTAAYNENPSYERPEEFTRKLLEEDE